MKTDMTCGWVDEDPPVGRFNVLGECSLEPVCARMYEDWIKSSNLSYLLEGIQSSGILFVSGQ